MQVCLDPTVRAAYGQGGELVDGDGSPLVDVESGDVTERDPASRIVLGQPPNSAAEGVEEPEGNDGIRVFLLGVERVGGQCLDGRGMESVCHISGGYVIRRGQVTRAGNRGARSVDAR